MLFSGYLFISYIRFHTTIHYLFLKTQTYLYLYVRIHVYTICYLYTHLCIVESKAVAKFVDGYIYYMFIFKNLSHINTNNNIIRSDSNLKLFI